jgi:uncharacterized lipoprotein YajG
VNFLVALLSIVLLAGCSTVTYTAEADGTVTLESQRLWTELKDTYVERNADGSVKAIIGSSAAKDLPVDID